MFQPLQITTFFRFLKGGFFCVLFHRGTAVEVGQRVDAGVQNEQLLVYYEGGVFVFVLTRRKCQSLYNLNIVDVFFLIFAKQFNFQVFFFPSFLYLSKRFPIISFIIKLVQKVVTIFLASHAHITFKFGNCFRIKKNTTHSL